MEGRKRILPLKQQRRGGEVIKKVIGGKEDLARIARCECRLQSRKGKGDADVPENPWAPISGPQYLPYEKIEESHG